ncbi:REP-associated tyrosine transposase [Reichenbachiella sp.]
MKEAILRCSIEIQDHMGSAYQIRDQHAAYYFTFQVVGWADVFSRQIYRDIIIESLKYCQTEKDMVLYAYVIMTNHVHLIVASKTGDLSGLVRDFKKYTSKKILAAVHENKSESRREWLEMIFRYHAKFNKRAGAMQLWTHENHAIEMNGNEMWDSRLAYIHQNPVRAGWVEEPDEYLYSSAKNYSGKKGLIAVEMI